MQWIIAAVVLYLSVGWAKASLISSDKRLSADTCFMIVVGWPFVGRAWF